MLGPRSFGVTDGNPHGKTAFAGVVSIAKEHLEMAPESLLAIAANQYPDGEVIPLTSWPEPSLITCLGFATFIDFYASPSISMG